MLWISLRACHQVALIGLVNFTWGGADFWKNRKQQTLVDVEVWIKPKVKLRKNDNEWLKITLSSFITHYVKIKHKNFRAKVKQSPFQPPFLRLWTRLIALTSLGSGFVSACPSNYQRLLNQIDKTLRSWRPTSHYSGKDGETGRGRIFQFSFSCQ